MFDSAEQKIWIAPLPGLWISNSSTSKARALVFEPLQMSILSVALLLVLSARLCTGFQDLRLLNLNDRTNPLANIMLDELVRRATNGFTPSVAVSHNPMVPSTAFSLNGFFYLTGAVGADCSKPLLEFGVQADACIWSGSFSLKLQVPLSKILFNKCLLLQSF